MINKASEILNLLGFKHDIVRSNIMLKDEMHYPLTGILGIDVAFLRDKIFNKLYCDLYEFIENILNMDWLEDDYERTLSEIFLDLQVSTFLNGGAKYEFKKFYRDLMFMDFGDVCAEFLVPVGIDESNGAYIIKLVAKKDIYEKLCKVFYGEIEEIVTYDDKLVMFTIRYHNYCITLNKRVKNLKQYDCRCNIEKKMGFTDPAYMTYQLLISILFRHKDIYGDTWNNASIIKIISELKIIEMGEMKNV